MENETEDLVEWKPHTQTKAANGEFSKCHMFYSGEFEEQDLFNRVYYVFKECQYNLSTYGRYFTTANNWS